MTNPTNNNRNHGPNEGMVSTINSQFDDSKYDL